MPAIAPLIPAAVGIIAAAAEVSALGQILLYVGAALLAEALFPEENIPDAPKGVELQSNVRSTQISLPLGYGELKLGGNDVFIHTTGENNKYLWIVQTLAEGECEGIKNIGIWPGVYLDDKLAYTFGSDVSYWFHSGTLDQTVDTNLNSAYASWTDNMQGTAYIVWKLTYNPEKFTSIPKRNIVLQARKVWKPDGTKAYTANAAAVLYDYLRSPHCAYGLSWPGYDTMDVDELDYYSYSSSYNYCNTKGWDFNGAILSGETVRDAIDRIRSHFRGYLTWTDGVFYMRYKDMNYETSKMDLTKDDIMVDPNNCKAMISIHEPAQLSGADALLVSFVDPSKGYMADEIPVGESEGDVKRVSFTGIINRQKAGAMGSYVLEKMKPPYNRTIVGVFKDRAIQLEHGDLVRLWYDGFGFEGQYLRVRDPKVTNSGVVKLTLEMEALSLYNDTYDADTENSYESTLPDPTYFDPVTANSRTYPLNSGGTLTIADLNRIYTIENSEDVDVYLPVVTSDHIGAWVQFYNLGTGKVTIHAGGSDYIGDSVSGGSVWSKDWN